MLNSLKVYFSALKLQLADIWAKSKIFLFGVFILVISLEFQNLKRFLIVYMGKKEIESDKKQDEVLATKEQEANTMANALIEKSKLETVDDNWYKK